MRSRYVPDGVIPDFDSLITEAFAEKGDDLGGKIMRTGIEDGRGQVYRVISTEGLGAYFDVTETLDRLGFRDLLKDQIDTVDGLDSRFVPTEAVYLELPKARSARPASAYEDIRAAEAEFSAVTETERQAQVLARLGQGQFRRDVLEYWGGCAVTGVRRPEMLRASHIKPWRVSASAERLDPFNGLMLVPNLDAAFDCGLISFEDSGKILMSRELDADTAFLLHISRKLRLPGKRVTEQHARYLDVHRCTVFRQ